MALLQNAATGREFLLEPTKLRLCGVSAQRGRASLPRCRVVRATSEAMSAQGTRPTVYRAYAGEMSGGEAAPPYHAKHILIRDLEFHDHSAHSLLSSHTQAYHTAWSTAERGNSFCLCVARGAARLESGPSIFRRDKSESLMALATHG